MAYHVLDIGYLPQEYEEERAEWLEYGILFDFAADMIQAADKLTKSEYVCIVIRSDEDIHHELQILRNIRAIPTLVLPLSSTTEERYASAHLGALQYLRTSGQQDKATANDYGMQQYLDIPNDEREPLTIITVADLSFCLEYRSVEVRGIEIELTEKEFDILSLLIFNQRKVFTYERIIDAVWHEDISFYSPKTVTTHISNLRKKLKIAPDVPEYIKSVRGVGYKFSV